MIAYASNGWALKMMAVSITPELALEGLNTYAGGLGVLEGDKLLEADKLNIEYRVLTLFYNKGYVSYQFDSSCNPIAKPQKKVSPQGILTLEGKFKINLRNEEISIRAWAKKLKRAKAVFFEAESPSWARDLTKRVYIEGRPEEKYLKYILLAKASAAYIRNFIGLKRVKVIDLQEAYTALLILALPEFNRFRFVIHTPGPWGHPKFPAKIIRNEFNVNLNKDTITLTEIGLKKASKVFTVSKRHYEVMRKVFPDYSNKMESVTNGISLDRWMHPLIKGLAFRKDNCSFTLDDLWNVHITIKKELLRKLGILREFQQHLERKPIILWARRITKYKRPYFVIRFIKEVGKELDALFILSGKAHPADKEGLNYMKEFMCLSRNLNNVVYVPDYDISKAKLLVSGSDLHLFTPFPGWEACGTSYMKTSINGVPTLSSRDGGALELIKDGMNSWFFGSEAKELIDIFHDPRAKELDERDYMDFKERLESILELYGKRSFKEISLNILRDSLKFANIRRVLNKYYGELG